MKQFIKDFTIYMIVMTIAAIIILAAAWWATSPEVWYAGTDQYESVVQQNQQK